jgi:hypothetical protein
MISLFTNLLTLAPPPVFAQIERAAKQFEHFGSPPSKTFNVVVIGLFIVLLILIAIYVAQKFLEQARKPGPALALFVELCDRHELTDIERRALLKLSRRESLSNPARLFVHGQLLERASTQDSVYAHLYRKLFAK